MSGTTTPVPLPPVVPTIAAPVRPAGPDPRLNPDYVWPDGSEIGVAVAHMKAWILSREHVNSQVPRG